MKQEIDKINCKEDDSEMDLYEIVEILVRNKKVIFITIFISMIISLIGGIYSKNKTSNYLIKDIIIKNETYNINGVDKIIPKNIYLINERVEDFFKIKDLNKLYEKKYSLKKRDIETKKEYLKSLISTIENKEMYSIRVKMLKNKDLSKDILNKYIENLKSMDNLSKKLTIEKKEIKDHIKLLDQRLNIISKKMENIFSENKDLLDLEEEQKINYLSYRYPDLFLQKKEIEKYYEYYINEQLELNKIPNNLIRIRVISDFYEVKGDSKAKLIILVGSFIGLFLGIMMAFIKEFIDGYKKRNL